MRTVLVTGASSGIGAEFARIFASKKANVVLVARSESKLEQLAQELRDKYDITTHVMVADLSSEAEVKKLYDTCKAESIKIDYLINNAGFGDSGDFIEGDWKRYASMIDLNVRSLTQLCHLFIPDMVERGFGRVLNVASMAGFMPGPQMAVYYATKAYVLHFSEALTVELKDKKVSVTALCPGATDTGFADGANMSESKLFEQDKTADAYEVASYGFKAMMNSWRVAIPGTQNMVMAKASKFIPRSLVLNIAKMMNSKN